MFGHIFGVIMLTKVLVGHMQLPSFSSGYGIQRHLCVENADEDIVHLFFECPFSRPCWTYLKIHWDTSLDFQTMLLRVRESFWISYLQGGYHHGHVDIMDSS